MELKDFVKDTLIQLNTALTEVQKETSYTYIYAGENGSNINFDLSVTIEEEKGTKTGGKINVLSLGVNGESDSNNKINNTHRIKFSLYEYDSNKRTTPKHNGFTPDY